MRRRPTHSTLDWSAISAEDISRTRLGNVLATMKAIDRENQENVMDLLQSEKKARLSLAHEEVAERRQRLRALNMLLKQQEAQQRAVLKDEADEREAMVKQEDAGYRMMLKLYVCVPVPDPPPRAGQSSGRAAHRPSCSCCMGPSRLKVGVGPGAKSNLRCKLRKFL